MNSNWIAQNPMPYSVIGDKEKMDISHGHPCHDSNPPGSQKNHSSPNSPGNANYHIDDDSCKGDQHFAIDEDDQPSMLDIMDASLN